MIEEKHVQQIIVVVGFQLLSCVWFFATPWTAALPCPSLSPWVWSNSCPLNWWCYLSISSFAAPFSFYFQSFQHQSIFQCVISSHQVADILERQLQHQSFQWIFRVDFLALQGTLKSLLQHHILKTSILWCSAFFMVQLLHPHITTGKAIA